jgi:Zn-dependent peptidase ImmA (M78 family)/transcriptional regulator with XRE-family HTH domain
MHANGDMLRLARQRKGFHQTDAAARLGVTQSLLSRYENRLNDPRDELLSLAARIYGVRKSFFFQSEPIYGPPVSIHAMWRRKADVSARELDAVVAELNIRVIHLRRFLETADVASVSALPRLDVEEYGDPEEIAGIVRAHWSVQRGPLGNLATLAERAGIVVAHSPMGGASISGATFAPPGVPPLVVLNDEQPADRLRFTLAHEIGHLVMHRFPTRDMENEANRFAAALLMPASDIKPYFVGRKIDLPLLAAMKPEWRVAMQALLMRAKSLGFVDRNREEYLWKQMGARRLRLREPPELDFEVERPTVLTGLFRVFRESSGFSLPELSTVLHLYEADIAALYDAGLSLPPKGRPRLSVVG